MPHLVDWGEFQFPGGVLSQVPDLRGQLHVEHAEHLRLPYLVRPVLDTHLLVEGRGGREGREVEREGGRWREGQREGGEEGEREGGEEGEKEGKEGGGREGKRERRRGKREEGGSSMTCMSMPCIAATKDSSPSIAVSSQPVLLTSPSSSSWVSMTIAADLYSHTILQKSPTVPSIGACVIMKALRCL